MPEINIPSEGDPVSCDETCSVGVAQMQVVDSGHIPTMVCARLATNHINHAAQFYIARSLGLEDANEMLETIRNGFSFVLTLEQQRLRERFMALSSVTEKGMRECPALVGHWSAALAYPFDRLEEDINDIVTQYRRECGYIE